MDDPEKFFQVEAKLPSQEKEILLEFLRANIDVFAWCPYEAPGIDPSFICYRLNVNPSIVPKDRHLSDHQKNTPKLSGVRWPS